MVEEPTICGGCGVIAQTSKTTCDDCNAAYPTPPLHAAEQPGTGYWVAVRATFTCSACRFDSPLNHFELTDGVRCTRCGLEQRYELSAWRELVRFAHEVGDFGSGGSEGRFPDPDVPLVGENPYQHVGTRALWAREGKHFATVGNPLCPACKAPVVAERAGDELQVTCPSCSAERRYEIPPTAKRMKHLVGVLADEHEAGGREVVVEASSGVVVLLCPGCAAPLEDVDDAAGVVSCSYCQAVCRISTQSHALAGHEKTPEKTWWLYFDGSSSLRKERLSRARHAQARAEKQRRQAEHRARSREGQSAPTKPSRPKNPPAKRAKAAARKPVYALALVVLSVPLLWYAIVQRNTSRGQTEQVKDAGADDDALKRFSFDLSSAEAADLLRAKGGDFQQVTLIPTGVVKRANISRGNSPSYSITVQGGDAFDAAAALRRLREVAPNTTKESSHLHEVTTAKTLLRLDPRGQPQFNGSLSVMTWVKDGADAKKLANAFWAVALYVIYGSPKPSVETLRLLNGPRLADLAQLDVKTSVEDATKQVTAVCPFATCQTVTDMLTKKTQLACTMEVDHPLFKEVKLAWPNGEKARIDHATLVFRTKKDQRPGIATGCLDAALGRGEDVVVDHASGQKKRVWKLGDAGDAVVLDDYTISLTSPEERELADVPALAEHFPAVLKALAACKP